MARDQSSFVPALLRLAWPVALARLGIMGMGVVDVMVVGQLAAAELPHQALAWAPTAVLMVTGIGMLTGVQVLGAHGIGAGAPERAGIALKRGLKIALLTGVVGALSLWFGGARWFTSFGIAPSLALPAARVMKILVLSMPFHLMYVASTSYLEAIQRPVASTIAMWCANALNLGLNLLFVPGHGAVGSAWATVGSRGALALSVLVWIWTRKNAIYYGVRGGAREGPSHRALLKIGAAAAVSHAVEAGAFSAMTVIAGRIGERAVSAYQIIQNMLAVVFMIALGLSTATAVLVSNAIGRKARVDAARAGWTGLALNTAFMAVCAALVFHFRGGISRAYTSDHELAWAIAALMPIAALVMPPDGGQVVTASALRARGDNWFPTASHVLAYAAVMPPLAYYLGEVRGLGVKGLVESILFASILSVGVLAGRHFVVTR